MSEPVGRLAQMINAGIISSPKTQDEISKEVGYKTSNNLTMIKKGSSRIAFARIERLAKALNIDPVKLMYCALEEYENELFVFLKTNALMQSSTERKIIEIYRFESFIMNEKSIDKLETVLIELSL